MNLEAVKEKIRQVPDFPKKGIQFLDITTGIKDAETLQQMVDFLYDIYKDKKIDYVAGIESRGFIFGMPLAYKLNAGFIPIRKPNKLPAETIKESYDLEYGSDSIEIHADAIEKGANVVIIDDLLATGGTIEAAIHLIEALGGIVVGCAFLICLDQLKGEERLKNYKTLSLIHY